MMQVGSIHLIERGVEWRIPQFFSLERDRRSRQYSSPGFKFQGLEEWWKLLILPRNVFNVIPVTLARLTGPSDECSIILKMGLKKADGTVEIKSEEARHTFGRNCSEILLYCFKSELRSCRAQLVPSDELTIVCYLNRREPQHVAQASRAMEHKADLKTVKAPVELVEASTQTESEYSTEKLSNDLTKLLLGGEKSDLTVKVKGVDFRLHSVIMGARTPVFNAMLTHNMLEKATGIVNVDDCEAEVFEAFVHHVYSGRVDHLTTDTIFGLFALADKYQMDDLKSACFHFIRRSLSVDTFADVVTVALTYDQKELLQEVVDFFAQNMEDVLQNVKWMNFMSKNCMQANELILKAVKKNKAR